MALADRTVHIQAPRISRTIRLALAVLGRRHCGFTLVQVRLALRLSVTLPYQCESYDASQLMCWLHPDLFNAFIT